MMFAVFAVLFSAALVLAAPARPGALTERATHISDKQVLQFAMFIENMEHAFYTGAFAMFSDTAFENAGFAPYIRERFLQIANREYEQREYLAEILGDDALAPCNYTFPLKDPVSFTESAAVFESVGVSAYVNIVSQLKDKSHVNMAAAMLSFEGRAQAWIHSAANHAQPISSAFDTPLTFNDVWSIASPFVASCPSSNPVLPFTAHSPLVATVPNAPSGTNVTYSFNSTSPGPFYAAYLYGIDVKTVPLSYTQTATVPDNLLGTYYTVITTAPDGVLDDANIVAGPIINIVNFPASTNLSPPNAARF